MTNRKPTSYGYRTTHEVYFETDSMAGLGWASPKIVEKFREIFGPATAVHLAQLVRIQWRSRQRLLLKDQSKHLLVLQ